MLKKTSSLFISLTARASYKPPEMAPIWVIGGTLTGLSAFLDFVPPITVRAQVAVDVELASAACTDISFQKKRTVPGLQSLMGPMAEE